VTGKALRYLGYQVQLDPGVTLRSYFHLIQRYPAFTELSDFFQVLLGAYDGCPEHGCRWPDFKRLELTKTVEMIGHPGQPRLEIYLSLFGVADGACQEIRELPLKVLLDLPLCLGNLTHRVFGDRMDTFEFETIYTLFEFIDGITWALSFHGAPPECRVRS
jgi:hypothetical protein